MSKTFVFAGGGAATVTVVATGTVTVKTGTVESEVWVLTSVVDTPFVRLCTVVTVATLETVTSIVLTTVCVVRMVAVEVMDFTDVNVTAGSVEYTVTVPGATPAKEQAAAYSAKSLQEEAYAGMVGVTGEATRGTRAVATAAALVSVIVYTDVTNTVVGTTTVVTSSTNEVKYVVEMEVSVSVARDVVVVLVVVGDVSEMVE